MTMNFGGNDQEVLQKHTTSAYSQFILLIELIIYFIYFTVLVYVRNDAIGDL